MNCSGVTPRAGRDQQPARSIRASPFRVGCSALRADPPGRSGPPLHPRSQRQDEGLTTMARTATASIYDTITNQIIAALERGTGDYTLPWHRSSAPLTRPVNAVTRKAYRGVNVLALWASAEEQDLERKNKRLN